MALSGSFSIKSSRGNYYYVINWTAVQNVEQNKSTITMQHYLNADNGWGLNINSSSGSYSQVNGGGTQYYTYSAINIGSGGGSKHLGTTTHEVYHNSDGTKSVTLSARMNSPYLNYPSPSVSITLDTIPRTSTFTIADSNIDFGQALSITIQRASTSFLHRITYSFLNKSYVVNSIESSYSYTIPLDWITEIPNAISGQGTVTVSTYNGDTFIGASTKEFTLTVPDNIVPTFTSITSVPNPQLTEFIGIYIQGRNGIRATINGAQGVYGSSITKYQISTSIGNVGNTATLTTPSLNVVGQVTITATITDSRNRTVSKTGNVTFQAYREPFLSSETIVQRVNTSGSYDPNGTRVGVKPVIGFSSVNNLNGIDVLRYRYKTTSGSWSSYINTTSNAVTYFNADADSSYIVEFSFSDKIITENIIQEFSVGSTVSILDIKGNGKGLAFGGSAEIDSAVEIKNNWKLIVSGGLVYPEIKSVWQPSVSSGSIQIQNVEEASYVLHGSVCFIKLTASVKIINNTDVTPIQIGGLPFVADGYNRLDVLTISQKNQNVQEISGAIFNNTTVIKLWGVRDNVYRELRAIDFTDTSIVSWIFMGTYLIN